jgi:hypothetical protein
MRMRLSPKLVVPVLFLCCGTASLAAQTVPSGWRLRPSPDAPPGVQTYEATAMPAGEFITVQRSATQLLEGRAVQQWLGAAVTAAAAPGGTWATPLKVEPQTANLATASREFVGDGGRRGAVIWVGITADRQAGRLLQLTASSQSALTGVQGQAARRLMTDLASQEIADARREQRGTSVEPAPPSVDGIRAGGPIQPGRYVGNLVNNSGEVIRSYDLTVFDNGEYAFARGESGSDSTGRYRYSPATGRLDITGTLRNNTYHPDEDFCLFGRDAAGAPLIYAEDYYGVGTFRARLRRVSEAVRQPPTIVAAQRDSARAEARRYKYVTAPGAGLRAAQIEAVFYEWRQVYEIGGLQMKESVLLLLTDGTVRNGMPVPPEDLDVALSRRMEPEVWGRWQRQGQSYVFAFGGGSARFATKPGYTVVALPAGMTLSGRYEGASSYQIPGGAGAWAKFGITFQPGARFERFRQGGAGMTSGSGDATITSATVYDDNGSAGGVSSATFAGGGTSRTPDTGDRRGTYRVSGHTIVLTYENGRVERLPFVVQLDRTRQQVDGVWMLGSLLGRPRR